MRPEARVIAAQYGDVVSETLQMFEVHQVDDYVAPFDSEHPGFTRHWWLEDLHRVADQPSALFTFEDNSQEVARASVDAYARIDGGTYGLSRSIGWVEVVLLEVSAAHRGHSYGSAAVTLLSQHYSGRQMFAFSEQADAFWSKAGWTHVRRLDDDPMYRPLFVSAPQ